MTWVLILVLFAGGRSGTAAERIDGYSTREACLAEAARLEKEQRNLVYGAFCVSRS